MMGEGAGSRAYNGMPAGQLRGARWWKSGRSSAQGNCVETARLPGQEVALRNSRYPQGPALIFTKAEVCAFLEGVKDGDFDDLVGVTTRHLAATPEQPTGRPRANAASGDHRKSRQLRKSGVVDRNRAT
jgi:hypothetical protein